MPGITSHVLDTTLGRPATDVGIVLERLQDEGGWEELGRARTDADGRAREGLSPARGTKAGIHRLRFDTGSYFQARGIEPFHPEVVIVFEVREASEHHHVPLLLAPHGYTTYRGS